MQLNEETIIIPLEEYKELLIIKGKYEELKSQTTLRVEIPSITYTGETIPEYPYKVKESK